MPDVFFPFTLRSLSKAFISSIANLGDVVIDCTLGTGQDAVFLADLVGSAGQLYGFDVQEEAILNSRLTLGARKNAVLHLAGHENLAMLLPSTLKGNLKAAMFNLGYLPGSDKTIVTAKATTLLALKDLKDWIMPKGGISLHIYTGHPGGKEEGDAVYAWAKTLAWEEWQVAAYEMTNKPSNQEVLLLLKKRA